MLWLIRIFPMLSNPLIIRVRHHDTCKTAWIQMKRNKWLMTNHHHSNWRSKVSTLRATSMIRWVRTCVTRAWKLRRTSCPARVKPSIISRSPWNLNQKRIEEKLKSSFRMSKKTENSANNFRTQKIQGQPDHAEWVWNKLIGARPRNYPYPPRPKWIVLKEKTQEYSN